MKILIAEDDYVCRMLLQTLLKKYGVCHPAADGKEALSAYLYALENDEPFDLVCLDIMMPEKDGQEVLRDIRSIEQKRHIGGSNAVKIVMTTALSDAENIMKAFMKGACEGYLTKPIDHQKLQAEMQKLGFKPLESAS